MRAQSEESGDQNMSITVGLNFVGNIEDNSEFPNTESSISPSSHREHWSTIGLVDQRSKLSLQHRQGRIKTHCSPVTERS